MEKRLDRKQWVYRGIFWDRPEIARMSPDELRVYLQANVGNRFVYDSILRRFIERGSLSEAVEFFPLGEIERGLATFRFWKNVPAWRLNAWRRAVKKAERRSCRPAENRFVGHPGLKPAPAEHRACYASVAHRRILVELFRMPFFRENFFLTGGTCLAVFYLGHRTAASLDFLLVRKVNLLDCASLFRQAGRIARVVGETENFCSYVYEGGVRVSFAWDAFSAGATGVLSYLLEEGVPVNLDGIFNVAVNKLCRVVTSFRPEDIVDLAALFAKGAFPPAAFTSIYGEAAEREAALQDTLYVLALLGEAAERSEEIFVAAASGLQADISGEDLRAALANLQSVLESKGRPSSG